MEQTPLNMYFERVFLPLTVRNHTLIRLAMKEKTYLICEGKNGSRGYHILLAYQPYSPTHPKFMFFPISFLRVLSLDILISKFLEVNNRKEHAYFM